MMAKKNTSNEICDQNKWSHSSMKKKHIKTMKTNNKQWRLGYGTISLGEKNTLWDWITGSNNGKGVYNNIFKFRN